MSRHERSCSAVNLTTTHRYSNAHANSSAFSAAANPNEDWTKISDLAERRRIQNRIAQRNYRKKLKRRLEDLERRAASTSASPEPEQQQQHQDTYVPSRRSPAQCAIPPLHSTTTTTTSSRYEHSTEPSYGPRNTEHNTTEHNTFMPIPDDRHLMNRSPPAFSYSSFGTQDAIAGGYLRSPALSSYSVPSPSISGPSTSYSNGSTTYFSPRIVSSSATSPNEPSGLQKGYFDQDYNTSYGYGFGHGMLGSYHQQKQHQESLHNNGMAAYTPPAFDEEKDPFDTHDGFESPRHNSLWSMYQDSPLLESPPFMQL